MKYSTGMIVMLKNGKNVYVFSVDEHSKTYGVSEVDDANNVYEIQEDDILEKLMEI